MSKEALTIPTPYGKRKLFCQCTDEWEGRPKQITLGCMGCEYYGNSDPCTYDTDCPQGVYTNDRCDKCRYYFWIYKDKSDEPEG